MKIKYILISLVLIILTISLRLACLSSIPKSLTIDEVNNGYTAYSILKTGADEWGYKFPASFKSIGDYKPPVLIYLTAPVIALFGLNEFSTRLPVALFSILAVPLLFILVRKYLFSDKRIWPSLLSTFLLATASWHLIFSRSDFEAVIALTLTMANIIFLFRFQKSSKISDLFFIGLFAFLSAITYHSSKVFVPLINLSFFLIYFDSFWPNLKSTVKENKIIILFLALLFGGLLIFFIKNYIFGPGSARAAMVFFAVDFDFARGLMGDIEKVGLGFFRPVLLFFFWCKRYLEYFSPNFYLYSGLELTTAGQPGVGVLNLALFPFFISGILLIISGTKLLFVNRKQSLFILSWLLLGFLPASIANNAQQPLRSLFAVIPVLLISVIGFVFFVDFIKSKREILLIPFIFIFSTIYVVDFSRFADYYLVHYPFELSEFRQYGWKEMSIYVNSVQDQYDNIYIDPRIGTEGPNTYGVPYLYFLFYSKYDPALFHNRLNADKFVSNYENLHFTEIDWAGINRTGNNLYVGSPWSFPVSILNDDYIIHKEMFLNGKSGIYAITNIPKK